MPKDAAYIVSLSIFFVHADDGSTYPLEQVNLEFNIVFGTHSRGREQVSSGQAS
jgi:hypothetical protein